MIVIVGLAAAYVARSYYLKFRRGKSGSVDCGCCSCDSADTCDQQPSGGKPSDGCTVRDDL